ncbi:hypothetical protein EJB05_23261 [Eragrostis curvula]|uniref:Serine/threonine-protein kinase BSK1-like TPR repeats domain-containing protein n=1 Tax=Eragrostis curvula TaxID=38414 RepID=A0A5J9V7Y3_9POAL|nr:hypothetical protein EJB05_23261 [Eragrostis curvula]
MRGRRSDQARRPTAAPFVYRTTSVDGNGIIRNLGHGSGDQAAIFSLNKFGCGVLHGAACAGHLEVCRYLVEELGGDPNMTAEGGLTPFMAAAQSGDISTVNYLLDRGGDLMKTDEKGRTVLHHAACSAQRQYVQCHYASCCCSLSFNEAGADVDGKGALMSPLLFATGQRDYTDYVRLLLKAGADPNIPDDDPRHVEGRKAIIKPLADEAFRRKDYETAVKSYNLVIGFAPDATLYSNRSLCKLKMGDGEGALSDAYQCRMMRPDWAKACYRQAAAHMLLKEYKQACDALLDAQKLEPGNDEIEKELRKAMELMKISPDKDLQ